MTLRPLLKFNNPDSTRDLNDRARSLFVKGIFYGGAVEPYGTGTLAVNILHPFATIGFDGMFVREDDSTTVTTVAVVAGARNYIVIRQTYSASGDPVVSIENLEEAEYEGSSDINSLIVFAVVDVPAGSTEVTSGMLEFDKRDVVDPLGRLEMRGKVESVGELPSSSLNVNRPGDLYMVTAGTGGYPELWAWNGLAWVNITQAQMLNDVLADHLDNLTNNRRHLDDGQFDAALGTVGVPSVTNRYVTSLDDRVPTSEENEALRGGDGRILSDSEGPSDSNRYIPESKVLSEPVEKEFAPTATIEILDGDGPVYVGKGPLGTAQLYFNVYSGDTTGAGSDRELLNSEFLAVKVTGVFIDAALSVELNPSGNSLVDALGFFSGGSLFLGVDNATDVAFRVSYGKRTTLGELLPNALMLRGPQSGQVDARLNQLLSVDVSAQFAGSTWDVSTSPGDVVAYAVGTGFIQSYQGATDYPIGIRGNANNLVMEGLYQYGSSTTFSAGDKVYADTTSAGGLTTNPNARFVGTFITDTDLLVNMNAFDITSSSTPAGIVFPGSKWGGSVGTGNVVYYDQSTSKFELWSNAVPVPPLGVRGHSNNLLQNGLYEAAGTPYVNGTRYYAHASIAGQLTTYENLWFIGQATSNNKLAVSCIGQANWEDSFYIFTAEHELGGGTHKGGTARTFVGFAAQAGVSLSNSLSSSTGMVLFANDTGQVFHCTNGFLDIWTETAKFSGPLEITNGLEIGGTLTLPGTVTDGGANTMDVFSHAARHLVNGGDRLPGIVNQVFTDVGISSTAVPVTPSWGTFLTATFDFSGRAGPSTILIYAVNAFAATALAENVNTRIQLNGGTLAPPNADILYTSAVAPDAPSNITSLGHVVTVANTAGQNVTIDARASGPGVVSQNGSMLIVLDLGAN